MAEQSFYEGKGNSQTKALDGLMADAKKHDDNIQYPYQGIEYTCRYTIKKGGLTRKAKTYEGRSNDYGIALASALENGNLRTKDLKYINLEVVARIPYTPKEVAKVEGAKQSLPERKGPKPSGSAPTSHGDIKLTDLV